MQIVPNKNIFLLQTNISNDFLLKIINQLNKDQGARPLNEKEIIVKIIASLKRKIEHGQIDNVPVAFDIHTNEYNFLIQNKKSLWTAYLIFRYKFKIYPLLKQLTDFPTHLLIEPVSYCNLRCRMCFQTDKTFTKKPYLGQMDIRLFKKILDEAVKHGCRALTMASRGEPLLHPKFGEILKYVKGKFFDLKINTNAMLLDEEKSRQILENKVTELVFSVDSTKKDKYERIRINGRFEDVVNNIRRFHEIRKKEFPDSKCRTRVSAVMCTKNFDTKNFIKFWQKKVDNIACVPMEDRWDTYNNKPTQDNLRPCYVLWERMYVWFDGTVNPCDYDYKSYLKVGNASNSTLSAIWQGEKFNKLRKYHLAGKRQKFNPCDRCGY